MIRKSYQSFTVDDLRGEMSGRGSPAINLLGIALPVAALIAGILYLIFRSWWLAGAGAGGFFVYSLISNLLFAARVSRMKDLLGRQDSLEVIEVEAREVRQLQNLSGDGPAYCFFSDDGQALLLAGQWLRETQEFPALRFRVATISDTGEPVRLESASEKVIPQADPTTLRKGQRVSPVTPLRATPGNLQAVLDQELTSKKDPNQDKK